MHGFPTYCAYHHGINRGYHHLAARGIVKNRQSGDKPEVGEGRGLNPIMSLPFSLLILGIFAGASAMAANWDIRVSQFPLAVAIPGTALALFAIYIDVKALNRVRKTTTDWSSMLWRHPNWQCCQNRLGLSPQ